MSILTTLPIGALMVLFFVVVLFLNKKDDEKGMRTQAKVTALYSQAHRHAMYNPSAPTLGDPGSITRRY